MFQPFCRILALIAAPSIGVLRHDSGALICRQEGPALISVGLDFCDLLM
jgi:hypothetical protein